MRNLCGWRVGSTLHPPFTTLHPVFLLARSSLGSCFGLHMWPASVFNDDQLRSSMMARLRDEVKGGWRVGEGLSQPFTSQNPCVYRGFRRFGEGWRVKARVVFFSQLLSPSSLLLLLLLLVASLSSSRRVVSCLAMARNCPGKGQYSAIARQYTLRASLSSASTIVAISKWRPGTS